MMKLIGSNQWRGQAISRVLRAVFYSAEAQSSSSSPPKDSLYKRITGCGGDISITPLLDQWVQEGQKFKPTEFQKIVKQLRTYRRYSHALQIQEWMDEKMKHELTPGGVAVHLDLISKVHGLEKAESYFNSIPTASRIDKIHGALLNCYAEKRSVEKANEHFQKMKELGFVKTALTYNVMLSLYSRVGDRDKVNGLIREMEETGVEGDAYTHCSVLNAYVNSNNIEEMDKLVTKMEADGVKLGFHAYFVAAKGYLGAGLKEKALAVMRKSEKLIRRHENRIAYEHLVTLYAAAGEKDGVYRIWDLYKKGKAYNSGYLSILSSLVKIDDIEGAEKIFEEWISGPTGYDGRIVNSLVGAYCKKHLVEKAFACLERLADMGYKVEAGVWQSLANGCCSEGRVGAAVEPMKKAIVSSGGGKWKLNRFTLVDCLDHLRKEGDREGAVEMVRLVRESGSFSDEACDRLVEFVNGDEDSGAAVAAVGEEIERKKNDVAAMSGKMG